MLVLFKDSRGRNLYVNAQKVTHVAEGTNGTVIHFDNGADILVRESDYVVSTKLNEALSANSESAE